MHHVRSVRYLGDYRVELGFDDGILKIVDLASYLDGEVFEPLKDKAYFATVTVNPDIETIVWGNGADFSPEFLYEIGEVVKAGRRAMTL